MTPKVGPHPCHRVRVEAVDPHLYRPAVAAQAARDRFGWVPLREKGQSHESFANARVGSHEALAKQGSGSFPHLGESCKVRIREPSF
jgi:hypothetical protein